MNTTSAKANHHNRHTRLSQLLDTLEPRSLFAASVTGYLPDYHYGVANKLDWSTLTAVNYFSLRPNELTAALPGTGAEPAVSSGGNSLQDLTDFVTLAHGHNVKVNIVIGGAGDNDNELDAVIANPSLHDDFAKSVQEFADIYDVDGVDLDWEEYDTTSDQVTNYAALIHTLKTQTHGLTLSAAVYAEGVNVSGTGGTKQLTPGAINDLDQVNVMAYDFEPDNHSPEDRAQAAMNSWAFYTSMSRNPKTKLVYGLPFYGRGEGSTWEGPAYELSYADIVTQYKNAHNQQPPANNALSATVGGRKYYYNAPDTIQSKTSYAKNNGFGGVMIWDLGHDLYAGNQPDSTLSLMSAIKRGLGGGTTTPSTGALSGRVLVGSSPLAGMTIYIDANNNSQLDSTEMRTLSDIQGNYSFSSVPVGSDRIIRQVMRPGYAQVTPGNNYGIHVDVIAGQTKTGLNFIDRQTGTPNPTPTPTPETLATVAGRVFVGTSGLAGVTIYYDADNDSQLDSNEVRTVTDSSGNYSLAGVLAGNDRVIRQALTSNYAQVTPGNNYGIHVNLTPGQVKTGQNFTDRVVVQPRESTATIAGSIFEDKNGNGKRDNGENGLSNWTVFIDGNDDGKIGANDYVVKSNASGLFSFTGLQSAGTYKVRILPPSDYIQTLPGKSYGISVTIAKGQTVSGLAFGAKKK